MRYAAIPRARALIFDGRPPRGLGEPALDRGVWRLEVWGWKLDLGVFRPQIRRKRECLLTRTRAG